MEDPMDRVKNACAKNEYFTFCLKRIYPRNVKQRNRKLDFHHVCCCYGLLAFVKVKVMRVPTFTKFRLSQTDEDSTTA